MSKKFIITGTDTDVGKTVFAAGLTQFLDGAYWKPFQSGVSEGVDTRTVQKLTDLPQERFLPEAYVFSEALSPHRAAELDNAEIDLDTVKVPVVERPLIIEGAGGLMVPLTRGNLLVNWFKQLGAPVILVARTGLGTINHTLLSLEALWAREIPIHGIAFVGEDNADNIRTISDFSKENILGRLPMMEDLTSENLKFEFDRNFKQESFV